MEQLQAFSRDGYLIVPADDLAPLIELRRQIFERAQKIFDYTGTDIEGFFNQFHRLDITGARLNELRMQLINQCTHEIDSGTLIFESFKSTILGLLGPDLLIQKNTNLVIQQPNDPNPSELHRDAPANSPYELVVWLPLVNCYRSKSMYVLDRSNTDEALDVLKNDTRDWDEFVTYCKGRGREVEVPFGHVLLFWTGLFHGSNINSEQETRWSLNMRYKNIFAPNGRKEPFEFFKVFQLSPLTQIAVDFERRRLG